MSQKARLSKSDWLQAGFAALSMDGPSALKAEPLARRLSTTKGSFYWHFDDVPAYQSAMLDVWEAEALSALALILEEEPNSSTKLRRLGQEITTYSGESLADTNPERAMRAWAKDNPDVAARVGKVDGLRLNLLTALLKENRISNPDWARIILAASVGLKELPDSDDGKAMESLVDLVLALR